MRDFKHEPTTPSHGGVFPLGCGDGGIGYHMGPPNPPFGEKSQTMKSAIRGKFLFGAAFFLSLAAFACPKTSFFPTCHGAAILESSDESPDSICQTGELGLSFLGCRWRSFFSPPPLRYPSGDGNRGSHLLSGAIISTFPTPNGDGDGFPPDCGI